MRWSLAILAALAGGCASVPLSRRDLGPGKVDTASLDEVPICGHEVAVELAGEGDAKRTIEGELLAATQEGLALATDRGVEAVPAGSVRNVEVRVLPSRSGALAVWTVAGTLSAVSHGYFLVFTAPAWLIHGIGSAASAEARGMETSAFDAGLLSQYARFPQGMPPGWPSRGGVASCHGRTAGQPPGGG
ncbi:MAG TPA: hypothetical protein VFI16_03865, partial [Anaeromyxobacteraceae bacterium]|nr:hypothetical protein [Anaeromyxobacteraceae bacterium]